MTGYLYAFGAAVFTALSDVLAKKILKGHGVAVVAWARLGFAAVFLLPLLATIPIPNLDSEFWGIIATLMPLEVTAVLLYMKALKCSPLSLTVPFLSLTPVFTLLTSFLMLGELPNLKGVSGICFIAAGAFCLNIHQIKGGLLQPFRSILSEKGSLLMIVVAMIYSVTSVLSKVAIGHSSPMFMGLFYVPLISAFLFPVALQKGLRLRQLRNGWGWFLLIGCCQALAAICHFKGISMIMVSYMISVKRMSMLFGVLFGWLLFQEGHIRQRLMGSFLMFAGFLLIIL